MKFLVKKHGLSYYVYLIVLNKIFWGTYPTFPVIRNRIIFYLKFLNPFPAYFYVYSRDCDHTEGHYFYKFPCFWAGYNTLSREQDEWSEGPFGFYDISKKEYLDEQRNR